MTSRSPLVDQSASEELPDEPGLLAVTVAALQGLGRMVETDWELKTFDVYSRADAAADHGPEPSDAGADFGVVGVELAASNSMALYAVWSQPIAESLRATVTEWARRVNTDLTTTSVEFSTDTGILAVRTTLRLGSVRLALPGEDASGPDGPRGAPAALSAPMISRSAFTAMLSDALADVETTGARLAAALRRELSDRAAGADSERGGAPSR